MGGKRNKPSSDSGLTKETSLSKKETEGVGKENECFLCGAPGAELCKACGVVAACPLHTSHHQTSEGCAPYRVEALEGAGRGLVAVRDIKKGELIFTCFPAALGPTARTSVPQCVACFSLLPNPLHCSKCGLNVCGERCARMEVHQAECSILVLARAKLRRTDKSERVWRSALPDITAAITTLRLLSLKWRNPGEWSIVSNLMCDKMNKPVWAIIQGVYQKVLHLDPRVKEDELKEIFGIQCTNGANLHFLPGHGRGVGVYPVQAFLNHSCMCNTVTLEHPGEHRVELRARWDVKKGEELTTSYIQPTQSTMTRRQLLNNTWGFWCACVRCRDPTECDSYLGALVCDGGLVRNCGGKLLHSNPLQTEAPWKCQSCGKEKDGSEAGLAVQMALSDISEMAEQGRETAEGIEEVIHGLGSLLQPTHYLLLELQQRLIPLYQGTNKRVVRDRLIQICKSVLHYMAAIDPDNQESRRKRGIEEILLKAKLENLTQDFKAGRGNKEKLQRALAEKQALMVVAAAEAQKRMMETSTNGAKRGGCCNKC